MRIEGLAVGSPTTRQSDRAPGRLETLFGPLAAGGNMCERADNQRRTAARTTGCERAAIRELRQSAVASPSAEVEHVPSPQC
jgi:hypothetical protein